MWGDLDITEIQQGDILRLALDNEDRIEDVRGEPVKVLRVNEDEGMIRGAIMGKTKWGQTSHTTWFAIYEFDVVLEYAHPSTPTWEV